MDALPGSGLRRSRRPVGEAAASPRSYASFPRGVGAMPYRGLRLCRQGGGLEAVPDPPCSVDLGRLRAVLEAAGVPVVDAKVLLIAATDPEVTISRAGRLLFKTSEAERARGLLAWLTSLQPLAEPASPRGRAPRP